MTVTACPPSLRTAGSAASWLVDLVAGPVVPAQVVHSGREAVYLTVGPTCVGVLSNRAVLVPCGVRTSLPALPVLSPGAEVLIGGGAVQLPGVRVEVVGTVDSGVGTLTADGVRRARTRAAELAAGAPGLHAVRATLPGAALRDLVTGDPASVPPLLGRGPGLTPLGDDVLSGWLVAAWAISAPALERVRLEVLANAAARTTALSATLLHCAARGEAPPQVRDLLTSLAHADTKDCAHSLARLIAVGDTSGAGLALGCLAALGGLPDTCGEAR